MNVVALFKPCLTSRATVHRLSQIADERLCSNVWKQVVWIEEVFAKLKLRDCVNTFGVRARRPGFQLLQRLFSCPLRTIVQNCCKTANVALRNLVQYAIERGPFLYCTLRRPKLRPIFVY